MTDQKNYSISELAKAADVTTRTIRYYVAEELLPAPSSGGRAAMYNTEHLAQLELIKILKDEYLPLHEIRTLLSGLNHQAVLELLDEKRMAEEPSPPTSNSAKEYLQTLLHPPSEPEQTPLMRHKVKAKRQNRALTQQSAEWRSEAEVGQMASADSASLFEAQLAEPAAGAAPADKRELGAPSGPDMGQSESIPMSEIEEEPAPIRWARISITPEVELHLREDSDTPNLRQKIEQLIKVARQILSSMITV